MFSRRQRQGGHSCGSSSTWWISLSRVSRPITKLSLPSPTISSVTCTGFTNCLIKILFHVVNEESQKIKSFVSTVYLNLPNFSWLRVLLETVSTEPVVSCPDQQSVKTKQKTFKLILCSVESRVSNEDQWWNHWKLQN